MDERCLFHLKKKNAYTRLGLHSRRFRCRGNSVRRRLRWEPWKSRLGQRLWDKKFNKHAARFIVVDYHPSSRTNVLNKNPFSCAVSPMMMERTVKNNQNKPKQRKKEAKIIQFFHYNKNTTIFVGNFELAFDAAIKNNNITTVINLCSTRLFPTTMCFNAEFSNSHTISYDDFVTLVTNAESIIEQRQGNIAIICENGVNKAPAVAIGVWLLKKIGTFKEANDSIDTKKLASYKSWDNLTVVRLRNFLRAFEQQL